LASPAIGATLGAVTTPGKVRNGPVQAAIEAKLEEALVPAFLRVANESFMHSVPPGSESHFKVVVVSERFAGQGLVARHRMVNQALAGQIAAGLHALSIEARTPEEWADIAGRTTPSPKCLGGSKADA
jgi:BolA protein